MHEETQNDLHEFEQEIVSENEQPTKRKRLKRGDTNYVNNAELLAEVTKYREDYDAWVESDYTTDKPVMSKELGEMIYKIATRAVYHQNYIKFPSIREEMVSGAILNCVKYGHNFNPKAETRSGYPNPFGYFTQICRNAYTQRIIAEKRQFLTKAKWVQSDEMRDQIEQVFAEAGDSSSGDNIATMVRMYYNVELPERSSKEKTDILQTVDEDGNIWEQKLNPETGEYGEATLVEVEPVGLECFFE